MKPVVLTPFEKELLSNTIENRCQKIKAHNDSSNTIISSQQLDGLRKVSHKTLENDVFLTNLEKALLRGLIVEFYIDPRMTVISHYKSRNDNELLLELISGNEELDLLRQVYTLYNKLQTQGEERCFVNHRIHFYEQIQHPFQNKVYYSKSGKYNIYKIGIPINDEEFVAIELSNNYEIDQISPSKMKNGVPEINYEGSMSTDELINILEKNSIENKASARQEFILNLYSKNPIFHNEIAYYHKLKGKKRKIVFSKNVIFKLLKNELEFAYYKHKGRGYYLKRLDDNFEVVDISEIKQEFREFLGENYSRLNISGDITFIDLLEEFYAHPPIYQGCGIGKFLEENTTLNDTEIYKVIVQIDSDYKFKYSKKEMDEFLEKEEFIPAIDIVGNFATTGTKLHYKELNSKTFLVMLEFNYNPKSKQTIYDLVKVEDCTKEKLFTLNKIPLKQTTIRRGFYLKRDFSLYGDINN